MILRRFILTLVFVLSFVTLGTTAPLAVAAVTTSGSLSAAVASNARTPIRYGGAGDSLDMRRVSLVGSANANGLRVVVGAAGEKRRVSLAVPSLFVSGPSRAMTGWRIECKPAAGTTGHAATTEVGSRYIDRYSFIRNLVKGAAWTGRARSMMRFSAPGEYLCNGYWGARSSAAGYEDGSVSVRVDPANPTGGGLKISAPLTGGQNLEQQCFLTGQFYDDGLKPDSCYFGLDSVVTGTDRRLTTADPARTIDVVAVTVPTDGRTILAQATIKVTTCSGQGTGAANAGCRDSDIVTDGRSVFTGRFKFVVPGSNDPLPSSCLTSVGGATTERLNVPRKVHHTIVQWDYRFTVSPTAACRNFKVGSTIAVTGGSAGIFNQLDSQITVTSA